MATNANLHKAKAAKNDEFYTQLTDVSKELMHYKQHFKDKTVLCNCDAPTLSAFWKYFHLNFSALGLKKLISTHYDKTQPTYKMEYTGDNDNDIEVSKVTNIPVNYNGIMGVPISFMSKYNPEQFEIVGEFNHGSDNIFDLAKPIINGKELYPRIAIRRINSN